MKTPEHSFSHVPVQVATLVSIALWAGCGKSVPEKVPDDRSIVASERSGSVAPTGHQRMLAQLADLRRRTPIEHPYIGSSEANELKQLMAEHSYGAPAALRWDTTFRIAQLDLQLGNERDAIEQFLWCREHLDGASKQPEERTERELQLMYELGMAYMRLGETQNCCLRNQPESCIMPIRGDGVHTNKEGSQEAIKCLVSGVTSLDSSVVVNTFLRSPHGLTAPTVAPPSIITILTSSSATIFL
jgi:hypothetical protein